MTLINTWLLSILGNWESRSFSCSNDLMDKHNAPKYHRILKIDMKSMMSSNGLTRDSDGPSCEHIDHTDDNDGTLEAAS